MTTDVKSYEEMKWEFYKKFNKLILPTVKQYEIERKLKLTLAIVVSTILSFIGLFFLLILFVADGDSDTIECSLKASVLFFCLAGGTWYLIKKKFEKKIKNKIMQTVCSCFDNLTWSEGLYLESDIIKTSGVVPNFTKEDYDDIFTGSHRNVTMEIIEAEYDIGSGKSRRTVFDGVIIKLEMNKNFSSHTVITNDTFFHSSPVNGLRHTKLEDVQFEKKFDVFTNDEVDARYLITPTFMERLKEMKTAFKADKMQCAFYDKFLLVALTTKKDIFSLCSLVKPVYDEKQYIIMFEEIMSIVKLIDHFKLDQKIGL